MLSFRHAHDFLTITWAISNEWLDCLKEELTFKTFKDTITSTVFKVSKARCAKINRDMKKVFKSWLERGVTLQIPPELKHNAVICYKSFLTPALLPQSQSSLPEVSSERFEKYLGLWHHKKWEFYQDVNPKSKQSKELCAKVWLMTNEFPKNLRGCSSTCEKISYLPHWSGSYFDVWPDPKRCWKLWRSQEIRKCKVSLRCESEGESWDFPILNRLCYTTRTVVW